MVRGFPTDLVTRFLPSRKLLADLGLLLAQRGAQRLLGFAAVFFMARYFSPAEYGVYQFANVAIMSLSFVALTGLENAIMQTVSRGKNGLYRRATITAFGASLLGSLALAVWALWIRNSNPPLAAALFVGAALFPFYLGLAQWKSVLLGRTKFNVWSAVEVATTCVTTALLIAAVLLDVRTIALFVALYLLPASLVNIAGTIYFFTRPGMHVAVDAETREMLNYGIHTSLVGILSVVSEQIERILIFLFTGPAALAAYYAGDRISELVRSVVQDAAAVLAPRFARMPSYSGRVQRVIWLVCMAAGILIGLFAVFLARPVLLLVFGPQYEPSIIYAQLLLCSVAFGNVGQFQFRFIRSQVDKEAFRTVILTISAARIVAALILVPLWGIWGAIASVFIQRAANSVVSSIVIKRRFGESRLAS